VVVVLGSGAQSKKNIYKIIKNYRSSSSPQPHQLHGFGCEYASIIVNMSAIGRMAYGEKVDSSSLTRNLHNYY